MSLYPVILNLEGRRVVVVGGGGVALRKISDLLQAGAFLTVIAPEVHPGIEAMQIRNPERIRILRRTYGPGDLAGAHLAFTTTDDRETNERVFLDANAGHIFVNSADDPANCSFIVPSWLSRGDLILAVSTGGSSPAYAARLRRDLEKALPEGIEDILASLREMRRTLREDESFKRLDSATRGELLKKVVSDDGTIAQLVAALKANEIPEFLRTMLQG
jgi:precorrin-2 dehydrogenase / sirohydrochlorin ferrochelatase